MKINATLATAEGHETCEDCGRNFQEEDIYVFLVGIGNLCRKCAAEYLDEIVSEHVKKWVGGNSDDNEKITSYMRCVSRHRDSEK
jgi:hypothetical protein